MVLGYVPDTGLGEDDLREDPGRAIEGIGDNPIEHLHQEWELLHNPAVKVRCESRGVGSIDVCAATSPLLRRILITGQEDILTGIIIVKCDILG